MSLTRIKRMGFALALSSALVVCLAALASPLGPMAFNGTLAAGLARWRPDHGSAQCLNYGKPSLNFHQRGSLYLVRGPFHGVRNVGRFYLPPPEPPYTVSQCEVLHRVPLALGRSEFYGFMFFVPKGWRTGTSAFWGVQTADFHYRYPLSSPIAFQLHNNHMTLALATGPCNGNYVTPNCRWRSNADLRSGPTLPPYYVIRPGMRLGVWHEVIMHVRWADNDSGRIDVWTRVKGASTWTKTVTFRGHPTLQWSSETGCCSTVANDKFGAYRGSARTPVSLWISGIRTAATFARIAASMP